MDITSCWSRFEVKSIGYYDEKKGYISNEADTFDPDELTKLIHLQPIHTCKYGMHKDGVKNPRSCYTFSGWYSQEVAEPSIDRFYHCSTLVQMLYPHKDVLLSFKQKRRVVYEIVINVYQGSSSDILLDASTIAFCNDLGIGVRIVTFLL